MVSHAPAPSAAVHADAGRLEATGGAPETQAGSSAHLRTKRLPAGWLGIWLVLAMTAALMVPPTAAASTEAAGQQQVERIAFVDGWFEGDIYTIHPDGNGRTQLTTSGIDASPAWSPDGARIVFTRYRLVDEMRVGDIWIMDADGSDQQLLTENGADPAWSPDGSQIAFSRGDLFVMDADGTNQVRLTEADEERPFSNPQTPVWSPGGERIAFADWGFSNPRVYSVASDGSELRLLNEYGFDPAWSPDGSTIAFARFLRLCAGALWVMAPDGSGARELVKDPGDCDIRGPAYSPDGRHLAFGAFPMHPDDPRLPDGAEPLDEGLHIVESDGTNRRFLTLGFQPAWQPIPAVHPGAIAGTVTDADSGDPIEGAAVSVDGEEAVTGEDGAYRIDGLEPGEYTLMADAEGYRPANQAASVAAGATTTVDFALASEPAAPPAEAPQAKDDCMDESWEVYGFRNQGQCIRYVMTGQDSRKHP